MIYSTIYCLILANVGFTYCFELKAELLSRLTKKAVSTQCFPEMVLSGTHSFRFDRWGLMDLLRGCDKRQPDKANLKQALPTD